MARLGEGSSSKPGLSLGFRIHFSSQMPMVLCMLAQQASPAVPEACEGVRCPPPPLHNFAVSVLPPAWP